ncbi:Cysteine desulfurase [Streptomyces tendae]
MSATRPCRRPAVAVPLPVLGRDVTVPLVTGGEVTYAALDYAASAPALQRVWDDVAAYAPYYGSVHRGAGYLSQLSTDLFENARATVAGFLGCRDDDQVVFTRSTTDSLNLLAAALPAGEQGLRLRDRAPRLAAALAGRRRDLPRRAAHPRAGRSDPGARPRRPRAVRAGPGLRDRRLQRHRRAVAGA